jgi:hypothetical protein
MDKVPEDLEFHLRAVGEIYKKKVLKENKKCIDHRNTIQCMHLDSSEQPLGAATLAQIGYYATWLSESLEGSPRM